MPTERYKKTTTPESLPDAGGSERKRVLNVLAQRRYRQPRREKIAALEAQAKGIVVPQSTTPKEVVTQLNPGHRDDAIYNPGLVDPMIVEEIVQPTTESRFAMFDVDQEPFELQLGLAQDFHGELAAPSDNCMLML